MMQHEVAPQELAVIDRMARQYDAPVQVQRLDAIELVRRYHALEAVAQELWPIGHEDDQWSPDTLDRIAEIVIAATSRCASCGAPMMAIVRGHHHSENGRDVTR